MIQKYYLNNVNRKILKIKNGSLSPKLKSSKLINEKFNRGRNLNITSHFGYFLVYIKYYNLMKFNA